MALVNLSHWINMKTTKPSFIGIGAARAGSTWLFNQLERDSRLWMPRIKELHYFSRASDQCGPSYLSKDAFHARLLGNGADSREFRKKFVRAVGSNLLRPSWQKLKWDWRYWLGQMSDNWYLSLFEQANGRFCGEITPAYSALSDAGVARLAAVLPDVKVIHFLREPVDRAWSLVRYHQKREGENYTELETEGLLDRARHRFIVEQSNYEKVMSRWAKFYSEEQRMVRFYDEITDVPEQMLSEVYDFLGLTPDADVVGGDLKTRVNPSFEMDMPASFREVLTKDYLPMVERLADSQGGYFVKWLETYRSTLS
jgi:hypothetical protein